MRLVFFLSAGFLCAQDKLPLSLKRAVEIALAPEGSPRVALAEESIRQSQTGIAQARAAFLPDIETSVTDQSETVNLKTFGLNFPLPAGLSFPSLVGPFSVFDARATATQSVFDFSSIKKYQSSKATVQATRADAESTRNQVSDFVARAYLACLRADAKLETERANVELSDALLKLSNRQKTAGTGLAIEVTRAQVQLANDRQNLIVAENDRRRAVLQLLRAMGLNLDARIEFTDKLLYKPVDVGPIEAALDKARKERAELKAQAKREEIARLNYGSVKAERLPSVSAFGNYGTIGPEIIGALPTHAVGITLKVPVFDGGRRDARRAESLSQLRQEEIRTRDVKQQVDLDVRLALDSIASAASQVETAREGLALSENELAQARRRYEGGVANSIEVTDAQTRLDRARDNQIAALYNYNLARLDLATATGSIAEYLNQ
jgi:outer membrane protein